MNSTTCHRCFLAMVFALILPSCSTVLGDNDPMKRLSTLAPIPPEYRRAKIDMDAYDDAEQLQADSSKLKGVKEVSLSLRFSDHFVQPTYEIDCRTDFVQRLRAAGFVVKEKAETMIHLNVVGMWDKNRIAATHWTELEVVNVGNFLRDRKHYRSAAIIWGRGRLGRLGHAVFEESFPKSVEAMETEMINDWITANQP